MILPPSLWGLGPSQCNELQVGQSIRCMGFWYDKQRAMHSAPVESDETAVDRDPCAPVIIVRGDAPEIIVIIITR